MHLRRYVRAKFGADYLIPLARMFWETEPARVSAYAQQQSFYDGTISTSFDAGEYAVRIVSWFDAVGRNIAGFEFEVTGGPPSIVVAPFREVKVHYDQRLAVNVSASMVEGAWHARLDCLNASARFSVRTNAGMTPFSDGVRIRLPRGRSWLLIAVNDEPDVTAEESLRRTRSWWQAEWERGAWLDLPDDEAQKTWVRSIAYILSSYNDEKLGMAGPMGFTGNGWPFSFPQDLSFIHPLLLSTGRTNIARSWVEYWAGHLEGMKKYTKRLMGVGGVFVPWEFPYGSLDGYYDPEPPNMFTYELHNSAYVARMAHETAIVLDDAEWTRAYAEPLVRETAEFYLSILKKENDGRWHIDITPSMGQDELGGENQRDYLCALYSAQYCLRTAVGRRLDKTGRMRSILRDGLAFPSLLSRYGFYHTNGGSGLADYGKQKHPPQLNPLAFLPVSKAVAAPTRRAYNMRYEITAGAKEPGFCGWTLGEFLLASARMRDAAGWKRDWNNALPANYVDPEWIQFYETSRSWGSSFYVTTAGLFTQAILDCVASDWWGELEVGACIPWRGDVSFGDIGTLAGVKVSGLINAKEMKVTLRAERDVKTTFRGKPLVMAKGEERRLTLPGGKTTA
ncbi:MAG: hypothetical protein Q7T82_14340 [Armatimonadota bacterium]|nr:hypothetical protein [Armatimonadota bacterium]